MKDPVEAAMEQGRTDAQERRARDEERIREAPVEAQRLGNYIEETVLIGLQDLNLTLTKPIDRSEGANARVLELRKPNGFLVRLRIVVRYGSGTPEFTAYAAFNGQKRPLTLRFTHDQMMFNEYIGNFRAEIIEAAKRLA
jgi:hypothetical protein